MSLARISVYVIISSIIGSHSLFSQTVKLVGKVYDQQTNSYLSYVNVFVKDSTHGTTTNDSGDYELELSKGSYQIVYSMIGYKIEKRNIDVSGNTPILIDISLEPTTVYMQGVTVFASKTVKLKQQESISNVSFRSKKIVDLPFSLSDVNRAIKTMPGITSNNEKSSEFNVRGGNFEETLVLVDGVTLYRPFHLKALPNASISIINLGFVETVNLITGGFPAQYGDKMSAVVDIEYRDGSTTEHHGQAEIGLLNSNISFEGPIGRSASLIAGFNKSYFKPSLDIINRYRPEFLEGINGIPQFYDYHCKLKVNLHNGNDLSFLAIGASDKYDENPQILNYQYSRNYSENLVIIDVNEEDRLNGNSDNTLIASNMRYQIGQNFQTETTLSYYNEIENLYASTIYEMSNEYFNSGSEYIGFSNYVNNDLFDQKLRIQTGELKLKFSTKLFTSHELSGGASFKQLHYNYYLHDGSERYTIYNIENFSPSSTIDSLYFDDNYYDLVEMKTTSYKSASFFQDSWQVTHNFFVNTGIRYDYCDLNKSYEISPRFSCSYSLNDGSLFKLAYGHYYQAPMYNEFKLMEASSHNTDNQKATHYILGYTRDIFEFLECHCDIYYKEYQNLIPYYFRSGYKVSSQTNSAYGYAKGLDLQVKYNTGPISGWVSYGYLEARENDKLNSDGYYPRSTDQKHSLSIIADWQASPKTQIYCVFFYGSGYPYTPYKFDSQNLRFIAGPINSEYFPAYSRLDIRFTRQFQFNWGRVNAFFEIVNVLNKKNVLTYEHYSINEIGIVEKRPKYLFPILPNLGINISL